MLTTKNNLKDVNSFVHMGIIMSSKNTEERLMKQYKHTKEEITLKIKTKTSLIFFSLLISFHSFFNRKSKDLLDKFAIN